MRLPALVLHAAVAVGAQLANAQPAPGDKGDAQQLMQSGVKLLEVKDYLGALAIFKTAYERFPSAKILLNIGTTLKLLDRPAEAANAYQRYLDAADADPAKKPEVEKVIAELDRSVGQLEITVTPADAQVQINNADWIPAAQVKRYRVPQGQFTVNARKEKFASDAKSAHITSGERAAIAIALTPLPAETTSAIIPSTGTVSTGTSSVDTGSVVGRGEIAANRSRLGALVGAHIDVVNGGGAALVGLTFDATSQLSVAAAGVIGPRYGTYAGASFALLTGTVRPYAAAGIPIFFSNGARYVLRAAGGVEWLLNRHVALLAELGLEYVVNPEPSISKSIFVPALGVTARL